MADGYGTQADYMSWVERDAKKRESAIHSAIRGAFSRFVENRTVEVVIFEAVTATELAEALLQYPEILKPLMILSNVAGRAIERDLGVRNLNTYEPRLKPETASAIAGYLKPFLPSYAEIPTLVVLDKVEFVDKEIRKAKGRWERGVLNYLIESDIEGGFRKRKFKVEGETFEIDAANPEQGDVLIAVDVKRIEARRDIHKRCDEIVNKASKTKVRFPSAQFAAVIYYPFVAEHTNVQSRLTSENIDCVVFASDSLDSVKDAVSLLIATLKARK